MTLKLRGKGLMAPGLAAGVLLLASGPALAQQVAYPPGGPKLPKWEDMADWDSTWERGGDPMTWDDSIPRGQPQTPPYNDTYKALYAKIPQRQRGPDGRPLPPPPGAPRLKMGGMPGIMTPLRPLDISINPYETIILNETGRGARHIYTDGRLHPANSIPSLVGHSIGYWKNKELYVDTCCFDPSSSLPGGGPHSDAMHITERFYSPKPGMLAEDITVEDPKAFTKPWKTTKTFYRRPDWEMLPEELAGQGNGGGGPPGAPGAH
jgi:hypothetical protein